MAAQTAMQQTCTAASKAPEVFAWRAAIPFQSNVSEPRNGSLLGGAVCRDIHRRGNIHAHNLKFLEIEKQPF